MTAEQDTHLDGRPWTLARERWLLLTLAAIQFTNVVDFLIILPLGPQYERVFGISNSQFGLIVAAYGIAAGAMGLAAGFFLDRFDRKKALMWLYFGFTVGTLFCAMAPTYHLLVAARVVAGAFGGVCGAVVLAIVGDVVPIERRGRAMGMVMSSFSVSSIIGVPMGLWFATHYNWHVPFYAVGILSALILGVAIFITPRLRGHLAHIQEQNLIKRTLTVMLHPDHLKAFVFMAMLTCAGFFIFPYLANYMVANVGLEERKLHWMYFFGGVCTLFSMNLVGRWADRSGKLRVFTFTSLSTAVPILILTNLPRVPIVFAIAASTLLMICMSARMVPAMAMMTAAVEPRYRGGFMSINSAVQQFSMGLTSFAGGMIIGERPGTHELTRFPLSGLLAITCAYICIYLARFLRMPAPRNKDVVAEPLVVESI